MFWTVTQSLISGLGTATQLFALTLLFGLPLGLVIAFGSMSKWRPLKAVVDVIVWIIRGTPLMPSSSSSITAPASGGTPTSGAAAAACA